MDQVRSILAWLKKQHFWVLCVLVALIGLFCWWRAAGTLSAAYDKNQQQITGQFSALATLQANPFHPNDLINTQQGEETKKLAEEVGKLWQQLYDRQSEKVLQWPDALTPAFREYVEKLQFTQDIPGNLREHYQNYIDRHFPKLPEKIGARPIDPNTVGAGGGFGRGERGPTAPAVVMGPDGRPLDDEGDYICVWSEEDQAIVRSELDFPQQPSALRIWVAQENLWVYHTLLDVIKNTNEAAGATRKSNAAVQEVYALQVGQAAAPFSRTPNRIYKLASAAPSMEALATEAPAEQDPSAAMPTGMEFGRSGLAAGNTGQMSEAQEAAMLLSFRYLGADGKPIPMAGGVEVGVEAVPADPNAPAPVIDTTIFGKEYKRLPIRMKLRMDQRHLPKLIAECATQPLQVEVQEVRINTPDAMGPDAGGMSSMRGGGSFDMSGSGGSMFPVLSGLQEFPKDPHIVSVVIQGVIYIFNKPDPTILKTDDAEAPLAATP